MYSLNLAPDGRVLSATFEKYWPQAKAKTDKLPDGSISDYKYLNGEFVFDPLPKQPKVPTPMETLESQMLYTAVMTQTLIEPKALQAGKNKGGAENV